MGKSRLLLHCVFNPGVPAACEARVLGSGASDIMCEVCWCSEKGSPKDPWLPGVWVDQSLGPFCSFKSLILK